MDSDQTTFRSVDLPAIDASPRISRRALLALGSLMAVNLPGCGGGSDGTTTGTGGTGGGVLTGTPLSLLAGNPFGSGNLDATGADASFAAPAGAATDSAGNVYVADRDNCTIRKITPAGVVTTLASGSTDATGVGFNGPYGVATDSAGNVYVADTDNHTIRKITPAGVVSTLAGTAGSRGSTDATGAAARFYWPTGVATDSAGNVYVADNGNNTIRKITPAGVVTTLAGTAGTRGSTDGTGAAASFSPSYVATDSAGNVYVTDNNTIRKITPGGVVTTLAGTDGVRGSADGTGAAASFFYPLGIATDSARNVYVADRYTSIIRKITPAGEVTTLAGTASVYGHADGTGAAASFNNPYGLATDSADNVYVADLWNHTIRKITPEGVVSTLAGTAGVSGSADSTGATARFNMPSGVATDSTGNVYVADFGNCTIRKITPAGVVTTVVGQAGSEGYLPGSLPGVISRSRDVALFGRTLYTTTHNAIIRATDVP